MMARATASPPPLAGEGKGEGMHKDLCEPPLSPPLPRKRGREQTEQAALSRAHSPRTAHHEIRPPSLSAAAAHRACLGGGAAHRARLAARAAAAERRARRLDRADP